MVDPFRQLGHQGNQEPDRKIGIRENDSPFLAVDDVAGRQTVAGQLTSEVIAERLERATELR